MKRYQTTILLLIVLCLFSCKKEEITECWELRELEWYVNDELQGSAGLVDPWIGTDISNFWYIGSDGYWLIDFASHQYEFGLNNRDLVFSESELSSLSETEWKSRVFESCIWEDLNTLTFCYFIILKPNDIDYTQCETKFITGNAYFTFQVKESCKFLEINAETTFTDTTESVDYRITARATYEYDF